VLFCFPLRIDKRVHDLHTRDMTNAQNADEAVDAEDFAYECPECGDGHDGMTTGTEWCPSCQHDIDSPEDDEEETA